MNNDFMTALNSSFSTYLQTGPRSNEKLKILHGFIAERIQNKLGSSYTVFSYGVGNNKESNISGRYINKNVDIGIFKGRRPLAGIAIKFVMSNYSQNSNNYFENMLGETANIRCEGVLYFQIIILIQNAPYFDKRGCVKKLEKITSHNLAKYAVLSNDNSKVFIHSPDKTLLYIIESPNNTQDLLNKNKQVYKSIHNNGPNFILSRIPDNINFNHDNIIINNLDDFIDKICYRIFSI